MRKLILSLIVGMFFLAPLPVQAVDITDTNRMVDLIARSLADRAPMWRCDVSKRYHCSAEKCDHFPLNSARVSLDFTYKIYERCDSSGCLTEPMDHFAAGIYTVVNVSRSTNLVNILNDGSEFVDIVTVGSSVLMGFGRCAPR